MPPPRPCPRPRSRLTNEPFDVDLANPGAGGSWTATSYTLRVRRIDASGNVGADRHRPDASPYTLPPASTTALPGRGLHRRDVRRVPDAGQPDRRHDLRLGHLPVRRDLVRHARHARARRPQPARHRADRRRRRGRQGAVAQAGEQRPLLRRAPDVLHQLPRPGRPGLQPGRRLGAVGGINGGHIGVPASARRAGDLVLRRGLHRRRLRGLLHHPEPQPGRPSPSPSPTTWRRHDPAAPIDVAANQRRTVAIHGAAAPGRHRRGPDLLGPVSSRTGRRRSSSSGSSTSATSAPWARSPAARPRSARPRRRRPGYFAEGYTGPGFDEYLTIQNPGGVAGQATITYFVEGQASPTVRRPSSCRPTAGRRSPSTTSVDPGGLGRGKAHATRVETTVPTVSSGRCTSCTTARAAPPASTAATTSWAPRA